MSDDQSRVREHEIDAILMRRLEGDRAFRDAFLATVAIQAAWDAPVQGARTSSQQPHVGANGTIDVLAWCQDANGRDSLALLIEDKISARFTPNQPDRYVSSAAAMTRPGRRALAVLCAPQRYLDVSRLASRFHARVSLESLAAWLGGQDRARIEAAIAQFEEPPESVPVPAVADFFRGYEELCATYIPELVVKRSPNSEGERPEGSYTIYFDAKRSLPRYPFLPTLRFSHQCQDKQFRPSVKLMFAGLGAYASKLAPLAKVDLDGTDFYVRAAGASLAVVHDTPRMDNQKPVSQQMDAVMAGLQAAAKLRAWMFGNERTLARWVAHLQ